MNVVQLSVQAVKLAAVLLIAVSFNSRPCESQETLLHEERVENGFAPRQELDRGAIHDIDRLPLLREMRDLGEYVVVADRFDIFADDLSRMAKDLGLDRIFSDERDSKSRLVDVTHPGIVFYPELSVGQFRLKSRTDFARLMKLPNEDPKDGDFYEMPIADLIPLHRFLYFWEEEEEGVFLGENLVVRKRGDKAAESVKAWFTAQDNLLWPKLDSHSQTIVSQSGISFISAYDEGRSAFAEYVSELQEMNAAVLNPKELEWFEKFGAVAGSTDRQILGMKYHEHLLEIRARFQLPQDVTFDSLIKTDDRSASWIPDLGLSNENLVLALALDSDALPNPAMMRFLPWLGLTQFGQQQEFRWLQGNMVGVLAELLGDSWNDLTASRLGLYETSNAMAQGQFAIVGVVDSRDPGRVVEELERISRLTSPLGNGVQADERDKEIKKLIEELGSDNFEVSARAETRLVLAGHAAMEPLTAASVDWTGQRLSAAKRILHRLQSVRAQSESHKVRLAFTDPTFWTTLNPKLRLEKATGATAGFTTHTIHISADPSKTVEEVEGAVAIMASLFGPNWDTIRVVQVDKHFVFMIGSDDTLMQRMVQRVSQGQGDLARTLAGVGDSSRTGQMQAWVDGRRIMKLFVRVDELQELQAIPNQERPIWFAIDINKNGGELKTLVPVVQIIPAVRLMMF